MTAFTEDEQWFNDLDWFAIDRKGKIGHFTSVGWRLLPPTIAKSKENLEKLFNYFEGLSPDESNFAVCSDLENHLTKKLLQSYDRYLKSFVQMSSRGLYSYDSYDNSHKERPYFRVAIPKNELTLNDLPQEIRSILERLKMSDIDFAENSVISEETTNKL